MSILVNLSLFSKRFGLLLRSNIKFFIFSCLLAVIIRAIIKLPPLSETNNWPPLKNNLLLLYVNQKLKFILMKKLLMSTLLCVVLLSSNAQIKAEDVKTFTLKNGMKFLVIEDSSIPNANMYLFYRVGSRNEYQGITGLSHFFERCKKIWPKNV